MALELADKKATPTSILGNDLLRLQVRQIRFEGSGIHSYELTDPTGEALPPFEAGAHIDVWMSDDLVRQYSLSNSPLERHRYVIAVLRDEAGRGGSKAVHDGLKVQDIVMVSRPRNNFALDGRAGKVILLAGGIGITPLKAMAHQLDAQGTKYELHYCAKDIGCVAFHSELSMLQRDGQVHFHFDGGVPSDGLDIEKLLSSPLPGTHLYYCGPGGFMTACAKAAAHWPKGTVHFEHFKAPIKVGNEAGSADSARPSESAPHALADTELDVFDVEIASTGRLVRVEAGQSIVDALALADIPIETSCCAGLCGTCKTRYLAGEVQHNDYILDEEEKAHYLTTCVSRSKTKVLVLDL
jgi:vanillate O-demethylase ferredoxin subunit